MPSDLEITDMIREIVPTDGTPTSNHNVMRQLIARLGRQVERDEYFALRQRLVDRGELIPVYGGYGGRVARSRATEPIASQEQAGHDWSEERHLYGPFQNYLSLFWPQQSPVLLGERLLVQVIGDARSADDRPWSIPDLAAVNCVSYQWSPVIDFEIHSFEVKTAAGGSEIGAYQAYAHGNFAHYTYFCWHIESKAWRGKLENILSTCRDLNVGLITCENPLQMDSFSLRHTPSKRTPSLAAIDAFIDLRIKPENKAKLREWMRKRMEQWGK